MTAAPARREYRYIVLGLGGLGSGAAYWLARRAGSEVLGIEQFELGHVRGESQDHSRIIRLSYHTPGYVQLAKRSYESWAMLEADAGERVVLKTGGLDVAPRQSAIDLSTYTDSLTACGVGFESLDAAEIMHRWPQWRLTDAHHGIYQAESGIAMAARANAAHQRMARAHGATLLDRTPVDAVRSAQGGGVDVRAAGTTYRCESLVVAAGPWSSNVLAGVGMQIPLEVTQEQVTYFRSPQSDAFAPGRFPIWIWMDDPCFYGFPVFGEPATKAARDAGGPPVTAETRTFDADPDQVRAVEGFLRQYLPGALGPVLYTKTCLYTLTPDRDFVIDRLPEHPSIWMAIGAGHAFKFASVIGRVLSELAMDGSTPSDIAPFSITRPILQMSNPPKNYMQ